MRNLLFSLLFLSGTSIGQTIAIIESYHAKYKWDADYIAAIKGVLSEEYDIHVFALDTKRLDKTQWPTKVSSIQTQLDTLKPDIAILGDDNALSLMAQHLVNKNIPVVFLGVNGGPIQHPVLKHPLVTGVLERPFFAENIRHLRKVLKHNKQFLILMDDSPTMQNAVTEYFEDARHANLHGSDLDIVLTNDKDTWLHNVASAHEKYDAIIIGTHHTIRDQQGQYIAPQTLITQGFNSAQVPIFSFWDIFIGKQQGAGGFTVSAHQEGVTAARLASMILKGIKPERIPQMKSLSGQFVYSTSGMAHWNLKLSSLIASQTQFVE